MRALPIALPLAVVAMAATTVTTARPAPTAGAGRPDASHSAVAESGALALEDAVARALQESPALGAAALRVEAVGARVSQAGLLPNPYLDIEVEDFGGSGDLRGFASANATVTVSQPLPLGGTLGSRRAVARSERELAERDLESLRLDVVEAVKTAFYTALAAQRRAELAVELADLAERFASTVRARVEAGKESPVEATRAGIQEARARVERARTQHEARAARAALAAAWGGTDAAFGRLDGELPAPVAAPALGDLRQSQLRSPDLGRLEARISRQRRVLELERSLAAPDLSVAAGPTRSEETGRTAWVAELSVELPLFDRNQGARRAASFEVERARRDAEAARVALEAELVAAVERLNAAATEVRALQRDVVPAARSAFTATEIGYREGKLGFMEVLDAQRALADVRSLLLDSHTTYALLLARVERLAGHGCNTAAQAAGGATQPHNGGHR